MSTESRAQHHPSAIRWRVVVLAFLAVLLDGFDTAALAFVVPTLAKAWATVPASFTLPLVLTNAGVVVGYLSCGWLGARFKRRRVLINGVALYGAGSIAAALVIPLESIATLSIVRLLTGFGLGVVLPIAVSLATANSPDRRREVVSVIVTLGLASGLTIGGFTGGTLIQSVGVTGVFWIGGILPLVLAAAMTWGLTEPARADDASARQASRVARLFVADLRTATVLLWTFSFLVFVASYTLTSWVPTLLTEYGFSPAEAPLGLAYVSLGGILGGLVLIPLAARLGIARALILATTLCAVCMVIASRFELGIALLLLALGGAGMGVVAGQIGQLALAVSLYAPATRTTGVGWAAALGRVGSIVGPGIAGVLLAFSLPARDIMLLTAIPVLVAGLCAVAIRRRNVGVREVTEAA